jgi:hypothetical protein
MGLLDGASALAALERLLIKEREALRRGDLGAIAASADTKQRLMPKPGKFRKDDLPRLERIKALAARNTALLEAARDGIAAARARVTRLRDGSSDFGTYSATGTRTAFSQLPGKTGRKA